MTPRFRVIEGGRHHVTPLVLPDDVFVLQEGLTKDTEFKIILSALNAAQARIFRGDLAGANGILAGVRATLTRMETERK